MGNEQSSENNNVGDTQINILNKLENHSSKHDDHEIKLYIILIIVILQLSLTVYRIYKKFSKNQALKAAKTITKLEEIRIQ